MGEKGVQGQVHEASPGREHEWQDHDARLREGHKRVQLLDGSRQEPAAALEVEQRGAGGIRQRRAAVQARKAEVQQGGGALIIALPLALGGVRAGMAYDRVAAHNYRTNGLLEPAVNPFLSAEEARRLPVKKRQHARR
eukprot:CAMPEP_0197494758 /NCGR_PEP_ID=MMETSP1311-20131121/32025_1 /TAXON_ID=464262 /ORGANISM="Genus nov. species nov., Strain RCC856" /LENGTH=137 /DNA_ID=CAMNT_0043040195 /DNA_START=1 /DNA_END=416 /DNA_ORIENTATION=-